MDFCIFFFSLVFNLSGIRELEFTTLFWRYKDRSVKVNGIYYYTRSIWLYYTLNGLIMLYLHYGKQFVKTVLSALPSGGAGQRLSCMLGTAAIYRDISPLDGFRSIVAGSSRIHEETSRARREILTLSRVDIASDTVIKNVGL